MTLLSSLFDSNSSQVNKIRPYLSQINELEKKYEGLTDAELLAQSQDLRQRATSPNESVLDLILPEAFALVKIATARSQNKHLFDEQLLGGIALHQGKIAEMRTGEGKTNVATLPLYLNALTGRGCHLVTPNDYLSRHGAGWMGQIYNLLGVSVGVIIHDQAFIFDAAFENTTFLDEYSRHLKPVDRRVAYAADITYGTNNEFGFDYLRDNMVWDLSQKVQRGHAFAIVDEVDSILIDEARTPLIISAPDADSTSRYLEFAKLATILIPDTDYKVDEKTRSSTLTELGIVKIERKLGVDNLYEKDFEAVHHIENALKARSLFERDRDYVVKDGEVVIVDEFTGRLMPGRRFSEGLHQALEAKENVPVQKESKTLATISFQNYFRLYEKLAGMTGTALTEAEEFHKIYKLEVLGIPTHRPMVRKDASDVVYKTVAGKFKAIVDEIEARHKNGQPILIGTVSVDKSELISNLLKRRGINHEVLNAKNHEREALIIAQSGHKGAVTVATNMAGRGVDIILGGETSNRDQANWQKEHDEVVALGGLAVLGTERHESRRIDNQLRGRAGRQGDMGYSRFYVSLQDDLMRIFGGEAVSHLMDRFGMDENTPLEAGLVSRSIESAQKKVEGHNFDIRKHLVEYDDVMNKQRTVIYNLRNKLLAGDSAWLLSNAGMEDKSPQFGEHWLQVLKQIALQVIDTLWIEHLTYMDDLHEGIGLRGYAQQDPLVAYKREGRLAFERLVQTIYSTIKERMEMLEKDAVTQQQVQVEKPRELAHAQYIHKESDLGVADETAASSTPVVAGPKVGRNDLCPCGSGKKYKNCHGK
ncbi:MAG: preprotein translocase subunit SecA [candidate division WWE3 bacterium]|nr:preprotein translocase subunit SecA [candidate division WWE3 bacterium]